MMEADNWRRGRRHVRNDGEDKKRGVRNNFERSPTKKGNKRRLTPDGAFLLCVALVTFHLILIGSPCHFAPIDLSSADRPRTREGQVHIFMPLLSHHM